MHRPVRVLGLVLLSSVLTTCAPTPPVQPTVREGYTIEVRVVPHPAGSQMQVTVTPPDPSSAEQQAVAKDILQRFLETFEAQSPPKPAPL